MMMKCADCRFRKPDERPEWAGAGQCRRYPPTWQAMVHVSGDRDWEQTWPWMQADDWCGEFQPIKAKERVGAHPLEWLL